MIGWAGLCLRRHRGRGDDAGFAFVFVLMITAIVMTSVAATLVVVTPNIASAQHDLDSQNAYAAAQSGIDDVISYLMSVPSCRSTTRVCTEALGASSVALNRPQLSGTQQSFTWTTDSTLTSDNDVRVHSTGTVGGPNPVSKTLVADLALNSSIFSYGYYTDFESQNPDFLYSYYPGRTIDLTNSTTYAKIDAYDNSGRAITVLAPTTVQWNGPATSGTNPNPAAMCGQHWYYDSATSPGRYSFSPSSVWGESGSLNARALTRTSSCDVVFATGMTFDGPIYTRDAMLVSDATVGGVGPVFTKPVLSVWGYSTKNTPQPSSTPWRSDPNAGGNISASSPYRPATATFDLQLASSIGVTGLPANLCVYYGPTRVKLNGDGTATVTSPQTTTRNAASDPGCYPSGSLAAGIVNFVLDYRSVGNGGIWVQNLGTGLAGCGVLPSPCWPGTGNKSTTTPSAATSTFWLPATGGASAPDQPNSSSAPSVACSSTVRYSAANSAACAWTNVATTTDGGASAGWTAYGSSTKCNTAISATDRELFECEYSNTTGATTPNPANNYSTLRTAVQAQLASATCLTGTSSAQATCLSGVVNAALQQANTARHPYNYANPASGDHRYVVTSTATGSAVSGAAQQDGSTPTAPMSGDALFTSTAAPAFETNTKTPITVTVSRQTWQCSLLGVGGICIGTWGWGSSTPQFTLTSTQSTWAISTPASGMSYFPNVRDVTQDSRGTAGAAGADGPGDLYVEGNNQGKLSLIASHDVVLTGDIVDTSANPATDAVDITAQNNVRNYNPVSCVDQTAGDINATSAGFCPNDISGLYRGVLETNGVLMSSHPAMQYSNMRAVGDRRVDAAIFALSGSFLTDNYNRAAWLGNLTVNGGLYQANRGANGVQWEFLPSDTVRAKSGYSLQYHYVDLSHAGLPYAPPATGGSNTRVWNVVSVSAG